MTAYCADTDLLLGNIPISQGVSPTQFVQDAADEIDSLIGFRYQTPVDISDTNTQVARPVKLLLKRLNVWLASGRLILTLDIPGEEDGLHAYGNKLVNDALATLEKIRDGEINLDGVPEIEGSTTDAHLGPMISNVDPTSAVDDFYGPCGPMGPNPCTGGRINKGLIPALSEVERYPVYYRGGG